LPKKLIPLSKNNLQTNENYLHYWQYSQNKEKVNQKIVKSTNPKYYKLQNKTSYKITNF